MSQRGRGSGPHDDEPTGTETGLDVNADDYTFPASSRPIAPYDPYRSSSGEGSRRPARNVAADAFDPPARRSTRRGGDDPFLPDDDPLNAEAWQLELDEVEIIDEGSDATQPPIDREAPPPRRARRQASASRGREPAAGARARRAARRAGTEMTGLRGRVPRGSVTIGVPRAVAGSPLVADQTAMLLLGVNAASVLLMALLFALRLGGMPNPTILHFDAAGNPDRWGPPSVLWRLPNMAFFITVMFLVVSWFLHPIDRFAARFALGAAVVAQIVAWAAVIQHLFLA